jgi:hypothetical protein
MPPADDRKGIEEPNRATFEAISVQRGLDDASSHGSSTSIKCIPVHRMVTENMAPAIGSSRVPDNERRCFVEQQLTINSMPKL